MTVVFLLSFVINVSVEKAVNDQSDTKIIAIENSDIKKIKKAKMTFAEALIKTRTKHEKERDDEQDVKRKNVLKNKFGSKKVFQVTSKEIKKDERELMAKQSH